MTETHVHLTRFAGLRKLLAWFSILVALCLLIVHFFQFDELAPLTLIPPWMWLIPAAIVTSVSFKVTSRKTLLLTIGVWSLFLLLFAEEPRSLIRLNSFVKQRTDSDQTIRIATLNCNMASAKAALEPRTFAPDVVLFQESVGPKPLKQLAVDFFGEDGNSLHGGDVSIIARGKMKTIKADPASHFVHAVVTLEGGKPIDVVSLRLSPPVFRIDFLSAEFWTDHSKTRKHHRDQLQKVADHLKQFAETEHVFIGGDFNLVGNDGALSPLSDFQDTFLKSGSGWGNTGTSQYPLFRVDQIWVSRNVQCLSSQAFATKHSDHRMVVSDLQTID
jgi:hypothetical protein